MADPLYKIGDIVKIKRTEEIGIVGRVVVWADGEPTSYTVSGHWPLTEAGLEFIAEATEKSVDVISNYIPWKYKVECVLVSYDDNGVYYEDAGEYLHYAEANDIEHAIFLARNRIATCHRGLVDRKNKESKSKKKHRIAVWISDKHGNKLFMVWGDDIQNKKDDDDE